MPYKPHDSWAEVYDETYMQSFGSLYSMLTKTSLKIIQEKTKLGAEILDIGAGTGRLSISLMHYGYTVYAVDASEKMLDVLKRKYALIDVPFSSSFSGLNYESETLSRQVEVKCADPERRIFEYSENVKITDNERPFIYEDNFQIRCRDVKVILAEFKNAGMSVREDISERFEGAGAHYFILDKI